MKMEKITEMVNLLQENIEEITAVANQKADIKCTKQTCM